MPEPERFPLGKTHVAHEYFRLKTDREGHKIDGEREKYTAVIVHKSYQVHAIPRGNNQRSLQRDERMLEQECPPIIVDGCVDAGEAVAFYREKYKDIVVGMGDQQKSLVDYSRRVKAVEVEAKRGPGRPRKEAVPA